MKDVFRKALLVSVVILSLSNAAWAGDNLSFTVSCTIPAIPGVNAPLAEVKIAQKDATIAEVQAETKNQTPSIIEEDKVTQLAQGVTTKTIYSR